MRSITMKQMSCLTIAMLMVVFCLSAPAAAKGPARAVTNPEGERIVQPPTRKATIVKKTLQSVTTSSGTVYALFDETIIIGINGKQLTIREMPVPCRAEVMVVRQKRARQALRIKITSVSDKATTHWTSKDPG